MDVMLYSFALTTIRAEFHLEFRCRRRSRRRSAGDVRARRYALRLAFGSLWPRPCTDVVHPRVLRPSPPSPLPHARWASWFSGAQSWESGWAANGRQGQCWWPRRGRRSIADKAIGLMQSAWAVGYLLAALLAALVLPLWGWRPLFLAGLLPALATLWIRRNIPEPPKWTRPAHSLSGALSALLHRAVAAPRDPVHRDVLLRAFRLLGHVHSWLPAYLSSPVERGGAGLSVIRSSAWIVPLQIGAFFGYFSFGFFADRVGRRPAFLTFVLMTALLVPIYGLLGRNAALLLAMGPLVGFFGHGYFSALGAMAAELFPPRCAPRRKASATTSAARWPASLR